MHDAFPLLLLFVFVSAVILLPRYLRHRERVQLNDTLRHAIDKGETLPPEMISALTVDTSLPPPQRDLRYGIILMCIAASMGVIGWLAYWQEHLQHLQYLERPERPIGQIIWAASSLPGFIGLAFILFGLMGLSKPSRRP